MHTPFAIAAVISAFAVTASAAPFETSYVLSAPHADFLMQLEKAADAPGRTGAAARKAADLLGPHMEVEERVVLPFLAHTQAVVRGQAPTDPQILTRLQSLSAELPRLQDAEIEVVTALVDLFAAAEEDGQPEISRLAERMIWHQTNDADVLYPAAVLVGYSVHAETAEADPAGRPTVPVPLYGRDPMPMMGVGNPHTGNTRP